MPTAYNCSTVLCFDVGNGVLYEQQGVLCKADYNYIDIRGKSSKNVFYVLSNHYCYAIICVR